jgi:predicted O-methyltransferase YrrM
VKDWSPADSLVIPGFMSEEELMWLHERAAGASSVLEVGCWLGRSTSALAAGCRGPVYTVDHFQGSPDERDAAHAEAAGRNLYAEAQTYLSSWPNVRFLVGSSLEASRRFTPASVDMVFLDGDHAEAAVLRDLLAWAPKARRVLCGHDADWPSVQAALVAYGLPFECGPGALWYMELI